MEAIRTFYARKQYILKNAKMLHQKENQLEYKNN